MQSNFRSLSGHLFDITAPILIQASPMWTRAYNGTGFANAEKRLFGEGNYEFYIGTFRGILGFHQINDTNTLGPKDFQQDKQSLESNYNPHIYLLRGQRAPLVHGTNKSSDPHQCAVHLLQA